MDLLMCHRTRRRAWGAGHDQKLESNDAGVANSRLDRLCHLLDDSRVLAPHPSACGILALSPQISIQDTSAHLGRDVGSHCRDYRPLARRPALRRSMDMDSGRSFILRRSNPLQVVAQSVQPRATRRAARDCAWTRPAAPDNNRYPCPRAPSHLPGSSLRNTGLERRYGPCRLLGAKRMGNCYRSDHDQDGR